MNAYNITPALVLVDCLARPSRLSSSPSLPHANDFHHTIDFVVDAGAYKPRNKIHSFNTCIHWPGLPLHAMRLISQYEPMKPYCETPHRPLSNSQFNLFRFLDGALQPNSIFSISVASPMPVKIDLV